MVEQLSVELHATFKTHKPVPASICTRAYTISSLHTQLSMQQGRAGHATAGATLESAQPSKPLVA